MSYCNPLTDFSTATEYLLAYQLQTTVRILGNTVYYLQYFSTHEINWNQHRLIKTTVFSMAAHYRVLRYKVKLVQIYKKRNFLFF